MAKDMYQKRKERKEAKVNNDESLHKTSINWDNPTDRKPHSSLDKISIYEK